MAPFRFFLALGALAIYPAGAMRTGMESRANPIRRVVNMLQAMQTKINMEGAREEALFKKFMCYCDGGEGKLKSAIADAEKRLPLLASDLDSGNSEHEKLTLDLKKAKEDRSAANTALEDGQALRAKESAAFAKDSSEAKTNIQALNKAVHALKKGSAAGFLQTSAAQVVRRLTVDAESLNSQDRETLSVFLSMSSSQAQKYEPQSGEILGIVTQMQDNMETDLLDATKKEDISATQFAEMARAKKEEIMSLSKAIETKTARLGELKVELVEVQMDHDDTKEALEADSAFLAGLDKNCEAKKAEWEVRQKMRSAETLALSDTVKILTEDGARDLFTKSLPSPTTVNLLQIQMPVKQVRNDALSALRAGGKDPRLKLLAVQLRNTKHDSFAKVLEMIEGMIKLCSKEQAADDEKQSECKSEIGNAEDEKGGLVEDVSDLDKAIEDLKGKQAANGEDLQSLAEGIKELDAMVAEATKLRKENHADFEAVRQEDGASLEVLAMAQNRLRKFYNPGMHKAGMSVTPAPASFTQVAMLRGGPGRAPEGFGDYKKMGNEDTGVMAMIASLITDLDNDMKSKEQEETMAQQDYEETLSEAQTKRKDDFQALERARGEKAEHEARLHKFTKRHKSKSEEVASVTKRLQILHDSCDWLLANHEARKIARAAEVEALQNSRSVLSGADLSL